MPPVLCALACSGVYAYRALLKGCGVRAVDCRLIYLYPRRENFKTLRCSNLHRLKVGFADNRAHPDRTSSASQGARMLLLLPQAFLCVLVLYQYVKVQFL
jgi:hypothetical protein